jgi:L-ascorbate metabolism protein UlaG (beta-lactamase superfamily)
MSNAASPGTLAETIERRAVPAGSLAVWWLGGSGLALKTSASTTIFIDPYLSDSVREIFGLERDFPPPITPEEVRADAVICTHWHEDHLDPGTIPAIARSSPGTRFLMPPSAMSRAAGWGVPRNRITLLTAGGVAEVKEVRISHTFARHDPGIPGWQAPDAMGVVLEADGLTVYNSGDTEYDARLRRLPFPRVDAAFVCINGVTGNMNAHEAALLVYQQGARAVVPVHHRLWARNDYPDATLDPNLFADTYQRLGGVGQVVLPEIGGEILLSG